MVADTIEELSQKPFLTKNILATKCQLKTSVKNMRARIGDLGSDTKPETEALKFYLLNHAWAELKLNHHKDEPLTGRRLEIAQAYVSEGSRIMERLYYYMLMICTRETRHVKNASSLPKEHHPHACWQFLSSISGSGSSGAVNKLKSSAPDVELGEYTDFMEYVFFKGSYNGGYGGPKWGEIARTLNRFVQGTYTPEMMVDTGWTLSHNNGPMFNKGMLYEMYSSELVRMLDVQRSGQIPQLLYTNSKGKKFFSHIQAPVMQLYDWCCEAKLSSDWETHINWNKVMELGSNGNYEKWAEAMSEDPTIKSPEKTKEPEDFFYVTPHLKVPKLKRKDLVKA